MSSDAIGLAIRNSAGISKARQQGCHPDGGSRQRLEQTIRRRADQGISFSNCAANRYIASSACRAANIMPIGSPSLLIPSGKEIDGCPVKLEHGCEWVKRHLALAHFAWLDSGGIAKADPRRRRGHDRAKIHAEGFEPLQHASRENAQFLVAPEGLLARSNWRAPLPTVRGCGCAGCSSIAGPGGELV